MDWSNDDGYIDGIDYVQHEIDTDEPAGWRVLGDVIFHSKAVAAIEVTEHTEEGVNTK